MTARPLVLQIGGAGDIAGGLSQVVESFCAWSFERVDTVPHATRRRGSVLGTVGALASTSLATVRRVPRRRTTVLAVHLSQGGSFLREGALAVLAHAAGFPVVVHVHGSSFPSFARSRPRLVRAVLRRTESVLVLSDETSDAVTFAVPTATVVSIPNAVALPAPIAKDDTVVFAGTVSPRKGVDILLDAWAALAPGHGMSLTVAGPIEMDLTRWGDLAGVTFQGSVEHGALLETMARARVVVLPSRAEAMPMVLLEAMASGCAAVSTDVGSIASLLSGGAGIVVPAGDTDALVDALDSVLRDRTLLDELGAAARARIASSYAADTVYPRIEAAWIDAATRRYPARRGAR